MADRLDPAQLAAWRALLEAHARLTERLGAELEAATGLPLTWYDVLVHLSEAPEGRLRMRDLAERVVISRSSCTRTVDRMASWGVVERTTDPEDKRGRFAALTPEGRRLLRRAAPLHLRGVAREVGTQLSSSEAVQLKAMLDRLGRDA